MTTAVIAGPGIQFTETMRGFLLDAWNSVQDDAGPDLWKDTTTASFTLTRGHDGTGDEIGRGQVTITIADFRKQLTTMRGVNTSGPLDELRVLARFGTFFAGSLSEVYGGICARSSASALTLHHTKMLHWDGCSDDINTTARSATVGAGAPEHTIPCAN